MTSVLLLVSEVCADIRWPSGNDRRVDYQESVLPKQSTPHDYVRLPFQAGIRLSPRLNTGLDLTLVGVRKSLGRFLESWWEFTAGVGLYKYATPLGW